MLHSMQTPPGQSHKNLKPAAEEIDWELVDTYRVAHSRDHFEQF